MYVVTGGAGFIGSAVVWELNTMGIQDILIVDNLGCGEKWKNLVGRRFTTYLHRDDFLQVLRSGELPTIEGIIHLGACSSTTERDAEFLMKNNFQYTLELCTYALERGIRFINASSAATYGDGSNGFSDSEEHIPSLRPLNMYGLSKQLFDLWTLQQGCQNELASFKFFNVYGPNEYHKDSMRSVVLKTFLDIKNGKTTTLFKSHKTEYKDGEQKRDFIYVKDCAKILCKFLQTKEWNGIINLGTGTARTWNELIHATYTALGLPPSIEYIPMPEHLREKYQYYTQADMSTFMQITNNTFKFTTLEDGIKDYVQKYLEKGCSYL